MPQATVPAVPAQLRLTLCDALGLDASVGGTLRNLNPTNLPDGALIWVKRLNRMYRYKKSSTATVDAGAYANVIAPNAPAGSGRFVACNQYADGTLSGGPLALTGFDLESAAFVVASHTSFAGTTGILRAVRTNATTVTVTSSNGADMGNIIVVATEVSLA